MKTLKSKMGQFYYFILKNMSALALMLAAVTINQCCVGATYQPKVDESLKHKIKEARNIKS